jgi:hypothetical protein
MLGHGITATSLHSAIYLICDFGIGTFQQTLYIDRPHDKRCKKKGRKRMDMNKEWRRLCQKTAYQD